MGGVSTVHWVGGVSKVHKRLRLYLSLRVYSVLHMEFDCTGGGVTVYRGQHSGQTTDLSQ